MTSLRIFSESASKSSRIACRDALVLAHQAEQDVLGADVVVAEAERLAQRELEHLLRPRRERDLARGDLFTRPDDPDDLSAHALDRDIERLEYARGQSFLFAEEAEQNVLGADVVVLERPRFFLSQDDYLAGSLCESLEHDPSLLWRVSVCSVGMFSGLLLAYLLRYMVVRECGDTDDSVLPTLSAASRDLMSKTVSSFRAIGQFTSGSAPRLRYRTRFTGCSCSAARVRIPLVFDLFRGPDGELSASNRSTRCSDIAIPELSPPDVTTSPASTHRTHGFATPSTRSASAGTSSQWVVHGRLSGSAERSEDKRAGADRRDDSRPRARTTPTAAIRPASAITSSIVDRSGHHEHVKRAARRQRPVRRQTQAHRRP